MSKVLSIPEIEMLKVHNYPYHVDWQDEEYYKQKERTRILAYGYNLGDFLPSNEEIMKYNGRK